MHVGAEETALTRFGHDQGAAPQRFACLLTRDSERAADLTQTVLVRLVRRVGRSAMERDRLGPRSAPGEALGAGVLPGCDDGDGASPDQTVEVRRIRGVDPADAIAVDGRLLVPFGAGLPDELRDATAPVRCALTGAVTPRPAAPRTSSTRASIEPGCG